MANIVFPANVVFKDKQERTELADLNNQAVKPEAISVAPPRVSAKKSSGLDALESFIQEAAGSASFGLSKHTTPGIMGLVELLTGDGGFKEGYQRQRQRQEGLKQTQKGSSLAGSIAGYAVPFGGPAKVGAAATKGIAAKVAPKIGSKIAAKLLPSVAGAVASYAPEQAIKVGFEGKPIKEAAIETAIAGAMPVVTSGIGKAFKGAGASAMERVLKPNVAIIRKQGIKPEQMMKDILETPGIASKLPFKGNVKGMLNRVQEMMNRTNSEFTDILQLAGNKRIDIKEAWQRASKRVMEDYKKGVGFGEFPQIESTIKHWGNEVAATLGKKKNVPIGSAITMAKEAGDKAWADKSLLPEQLKGQLFTREYWKQLRSGISEKLPELEPKYAELSKLHPIKKVLEPGEWRIGKKDLVGLMPWLVASAPYLAAGGGVGYMAGDAPGAIGGGLGALGAYKTIQSPQAAKAIYDLGRTLSKDWAGRASSRMVGRGMEMNKDFEESRRNALERRLRSIE